MTYTPDELRAMALDAHSPHCGCCGVPFPWCRTATEEQKTEVAARARQYWSVDVIRMAREHRAEKHPDGEKCHCFHIREFCEVCAVEAGIPWIGVNGMSDTKCTHRGTMGTSFVHPNAGRNFWTCLACTESHPYEWEPKPAITETLMDLPGVGVVGSSAEVCVPCQKREHERCMKFTANGALCGCACQEKRRNSTTDENNKESHSL